MNLQEHIRRILREIADTSLETELKKEINVAFNRLKNEHKTNLENSKKILDPYSIIEEFKNYLISQIPTIINQLKIGQGGATFAYNCYIFFKKLVSSELQKMNGIKKYGITLLLGNEDKVKEEMMKKDITDYLQIYKGLIDFPFMIGHMDKVRSFEKNLWKWEKQSEDWVNKNQKFIKTDIINTIINNLY